MRRLWPNFNGAQVLMGLGLWVTLVGCGPSQADLRAIDERATYHYNLAYGHYMEATTVNVDAALQEVLAAIRTKPKFPDAHLLAGIIYLGRSLNLEAIRHFKRAVALKPDFFMARNNLGAAYLAAERWDEAAEVFSQLVGNILYPAPGHGYNNLGWAYYKMGRPDEARRHLSMAIQLAPELCPPYNNLGLLLLEQSRLDRSAKNLRRAIKRCPNYAEPNFHLGRVAMRRGDIDDARDRFRRCLELAGDTPLAERCEERLKALPPKGSR
jgi:type IV pilus assembly protein PilF